MENETVSKNFIEQEIDKDLAEGVYDHVCYEREDGVCRLDQRRY